MNELKKANTPFSIKKFLILFVITATILTFVLQLLLTILQKNQPQPIETPTTLPEKPSIQTPLTKEQNLQTFEYVGPTPTLPKTLTIYQNQSTLPPISLTKLQEIATQIGMKKDSTRMLWVDKNRGYSLYYNEEKNSIHYTGIVPPPFEVNAVNKEVATQLASEALALFSTTLYLTPQTNSIQFLRGESELTQTTEEQATAYSIPFSLTFQGYPFSHTGSTNFPATVLVDSGGVVKKISIQNVAYQPTEGGITTVKTIPEMLSFMQQGEYALLSYQISGKLLTPKELRGARFTNMRIEYQMVPSSKIIMPFAIFSGTATTAEGDSANVEVMTSAIQTL